LVLEIKEKKKQNLRNLEGDGGISMAVPLDVYSLYKIYNVLNNASEFLLIKAVKPAWSNAIESEGEKAEDILEKKIVLALNKFMSQSNYTDYELIGQFEGEPEGDIFYEDHGGVNIDFWMAKSGFGSPWIIISQAQSEEEFWRIVEGDIFLSNAKPINPAVKVRAFFITGLD
jgi:hypothetical protein